jgi:hypothetical protein
VPHIWYDGIWQWKIVKILRWWSIPVCLYLGNYAPQRKVFKQKVPHVTGWDWWEWTQCHFFQNNRHFRFLTQLHYCIVRYLAGKWLFFTFFVAFSWRQWHAMRLEMGVQSSLKGQKLAFLDNFFVVFFRLFSHLGHLLVASTGKKFENHAQLFCRIKSNFHFSSASHILTQTLGRNSTASIICYIHILRYVHNDYHSAVMGYCHNYLPVYFTNALLPCTIGNLFHI